MWRAWTSAKRWHTRPSSIYGIRDELAAYCFDSAVSIFGVAVENAIDEATRNAKKREEADRKAAAVLEMWLADRDAMHDIRHDPAYRMPSEFV